MRDSLSALQRVGYPDNALALLESMQADVGWGPAQVQRYLTALERLHEVEGWQTVCELALRKWRPGPDEILKKAALMFSPYPDADIAFGEVVVKMGTEGTYGGEPKWSHPNIKRAIFGIGGWYHICTDSGSLSSAFKAQFRDSYNTAAEIWIEAVIRQLGLPAAQRDSRFFTAYQPFVYFDDFLQSVAGKGDIILHPPAASPLELRNAPDEARAEMPDNILRLADCLDINARRDKSA